MKLGYSMFEVKLLLAWLTMKLLWNSHVIENASIWICFSYHNKYLSHSNSKGDFTRKLWILFLFWYKRRKKLCSLKLTSFAYIFLFYNRPNAKNNNCMLPNSRKLHCRRFQHSYYWNSEHYSVRYCLKEIVEMSYAYWTR